MDSRYTVNSENAAWRVVEDEVVILSAATTCYYSLNDTGTFVWKLLLDDHSTVDAMAGSLAARHDLPTEQVHGDLAGFLAELEEENLVNTEAVEPVPHAPAPDASAGPVTEATTSPYEAPELRKFDTLRQLIVSAE